MIEASGDASTYDAPEPNEWDKFQDAGHSHFHNSLIWGEGLENIAITGGGRISGKALNRGGGAGGDKAIALKLCRNVTLRDFSIANGGHFGIIATGVDNLTIDNVMIDTNRDGIDIDSCRNVRISNSSINSPNDDAITLKGTHALGARAREREHHDYQLPGKWIRDRLPAGWNLQAHREKRARSRWPHGADQDRHGIRGRFPQHRHLEHRLRYLARPGARERGWLAHRGCHGFQHHHARRIERANLHPPGQPLARAGGHGRRCHEADQHQQRDRLQRRPAVWVDHQRHSGPRRRRRETQRNPSGLPGRAYRSTTRRNSRPTW